MQFFLILAFLLHEELSISIAMGNAQWARGIMLLEADVGTDEHTSYNTLQHHHCCITTERANGFSAFLIKLDPEE